MARIAPRLTKNANGYFDLLVENGRVPMATDGTQVAQHVATRIQMYSAYKDAPSDASLNGEIEGRETNGTDYYGTVFRMEKSKAEKEFHLKERILTANDVEKITEWNWSQTGHSLNISGTVKTIYGEVELPGVITPL